MCRIDIDVHFAFPMMSVPRCTEGGCNKPIMQSNWSDTKLSLLRHIESVHHIPKLSPVLWCDRCHVTVPTKVSSHTCFRQGGYFRVDLTTVATHINAINAPSPFPICTALITICDTMTSYKHPKVLIGEVFANLLKIVRRLLADHLL